MRNILFIILITCLCGCKDEPKYKNTINDYLKSNLKDPKSYECISLGSPKVVTPMVLALSETIKRAENGEFPMDSVNSKLSQIKAIFESNGTNPYDTIYWEVSHKYRAKNSFGAYELSDVTYLISKDQSKIEKVNSK